VRFWFARRRGKLYARDMFKITIICLGKYKERAYLDLEKEYLKRLAHFGKIKVVELSEVAYQAKDDLDRVKLKEADLIRKHLPSGAIVILLAEKGALRDSIEFAKTMERLSSLGEELVFVIGGGLGLHASLNEVSNYTFSLSKLTFPHNLARILLLEQLYRAGTIISGKEYHK
jgi:23S rRNA (pseudouridine1915-N3)-methyltransferase